MSNNKHIRGNLEHFLRTALHFCAKKAADVAFCTKTGRKIGRAFVNHPGRIQFFSYECANLALTAKAFMTAAAGGPAVHWVAEAATGGVFFASSLTLERYTPEKPHIKLLGATGLTTASVILAATGYPLAVLLSVAYMETARAGYRDLKAKTAEMRQNGQEVTGPMRAAEIFGDSTIKWYAKSIESLLSRATRMGQYLNDHPDEAGYLIKLLPRAEYIGKNLEKTISGDLSAAVNVGVGLTWLAGGDNALLMFAEGPRKALSASIDRRDSTLKAQPL